MYAYGSALNRQGDPVGFNGKCKYDEKYTLEGVVPGDLRVGSRPIVYLGRLNVGNVT